MGDYSLDHWAWNVKGSWLTEGKSYTKQFLETYLKELPAPHFMLPGNHEHRIYKQDGIDITALMCSQLGIADRYSNTTSLLFIRFGKGAKNGHNRRQLYTMYVTHGSGGGRKEGGKVNRLADLASIVDADIYVMGHVHLPVIMKESFFRVSGANSSVAQVEKLFVNTAASLNYGGYGDKQGFKPSSTTSPVIYLSGTDHKAWAKL